MFQTEYDFTLPVGLLINGEILKSGKMRLATAGDEINAAMKSRNNPEYMIIYLLASVVSFNGIGNITNKEIESLRTVDFTFLQNMYNTINDAEPMIMRITCPLCGGSFTEEVNFSTPE